MPEHGATEGASRNGPRPLTPSELRVAKLGALVIAALAFGGLFMSFQTVYGYAVDEGLPQPYFMWGLFADTFIGSLLFLDWLFTRVGRSGRWLRLTAWAVAGLIVWINWSGEHKSIQGQFIHALAPITWVVAVEALRYLVQRQVERDNESAMDSVRISRWIAYPRETLILRRRMIRWEETSYRRALARQGAILMAKQAAKTELKRLGQGGWRWQTPKHVRKQLSTGLLPPTVLAIVFTAMGDMTVDWQTAVRSWIKAEVYAACAPPPPVPEGEIVYEEDKLSRVERKPLAGVTGSRIIEFEWGPYLSGPHSPVVYFLRNGNRVKIGWTQFLRGRIRSMCLTDEAIELLLHGDSGLETQVHNLLAQYRVGNSEWFRYEDEVKRFIASGWRQIAASNGDSSALTNPPTGASNVANSGPAWPPTGASDFARQAPTNRQDGDNSSPNDHRRSSRSSAKRRRQKTRRSMDEWVKITDPIFHAEMERLRRPPTGPEFAEAIAQAGLGKVSASTAKNIRTKIIDLMPLPDLEAE